MKSEIEYKRMFAKLNYGKASSCELFVKWCIKNDIDRLIETCTSDYRKVYKNGLKGLRNRISGFPMRDHSSFWITGSKKKILVTQPYLYDGSDLEVEKMKIWADENNLDLYIDTESWYYPTRTYLIEITEKEK